MTLISRPGIPQDAIPGRTYPAARPAFSATVSTDAGGRFSFSGIVPGGYGLRAIHTGYNPAAYGAGRTGGPARVLGVPSGAHLDDLRLIMSLRFETTLTGKILDKSGGEIPEAEVQLVRVTRPMGHTRLSPLATVYADSQGDFVITDQNVPPGDYYLVASLTKWMTQRTPLKYDYVTTWYPGVAELSSAKPIHMGTVAGNQKVDITMATGPVYFARGKVTGKISGVSADSLRVIVTSAGDSANPSPLLGNSSMVGVRVARNGSFELPLPGPGSYYLTATESPAVVSLGCQRIQVADHDLNDVTIALQPHRELRGVVRIEPAAGASAAKLPPMRISLASNEVITNRNSAVATVGEDGSFVFPDLAPGAYRVGVMPIPAGLYLKSILVGSREVADSEIEFLSAAEVGPVTITLSGDGGSINGSVTLVVAGSIVSVAPDAMPGIAARYKRTTVDATGHFRLDALPPGKYRVYAWEGPDLPLITDSDYLEKFADKSVNVEVKPGGAETVSLTPIPAN